MSQYVPKGTIKEADWVLEVDYPLALFPEFDDVIDRLTGSVEFIRQCWGEEINGKVRRLKYSYWDLPIAMGIAKLIASHKKVLRVEVYDIQYPPLDEALLTA